MMSESRLTIYLLVVIILVNYRDSKQFRFNSIFLTQLDQFTINIQ